MNRFFNWIYQTVVFYFKFFIFICVFLLLAIFATVHAAIFGGPVMSDDMWFVAKIIFLLFLPLAVWLLVSSVKGACGLPIGLILTLMCALGMSWGTYVHAPQFREAVLYSVEDGRLVVPEDNRELFLRDCGFIEHEGMKETCRVLIYCQDPEWDADGRVGCDGLLRKATSPALLDLALQERRDYEYDKR